MVTRHMRFCFFVISTKPAIQYYVLITPVQQAALEVSDADLSPFITIEEESKRRARSKAVSV